ncbi:MAG: hypothetical protein RL385_5605 [Pseudomonadota bacterium]
MATERGALSVGGSVPSGAHIGQPPHKVAPRPRTERVTQRGVVGPGDTLWLDTQAFAAASPRRSSRSAAMGGICRPRTAS